MSKVPLKRKCSSRAAPEEKAVNDSSISERRDWYSRRSPSVCASCALLSSQNAIFIAIASFHNPCKNTPNPHNLLNRPQRNSKIVSHDMELRQYRHLCGIDANPYQFSANGGMRLSERKDYSVISPPAFIIGGLPHKLIPQNTSLILKWKTLL